MRARARNAALICHGLLIAALAAAILVPPTPLKIVVALLVLAPLAATIRGLVHGNPQSRRWLAALLVPYIGGLCVEVVARAGAAPLLGIALLAAVAELGVLFAVSLRPQGARE